MKYSAEEIKFLIQALLAQQASVGTGCARAYASIRQVHRVINKNPR